MAQKRLWHGISGTTIRDLLQISARLATFRPHVRVIAASACLKQTLLIFVLLWEAERLLPSSGRVQLDDTWPLTMQSMIEVAGLRCWDIFPGFESPSCNGSGEPQVPQTNHRPRYASIWRFSAIASECSQQTSMIAYASDLMVKGPQEDEHQMSRPSKQSSDSTCFPRQTFNTWNVSR